MSAACRYEGTFVKRTRVDLDAPLASTCDRCVAVTSPAGVSKRMIVSGSVARIEAFLDRHVVMAIVPWPHIVL